MHNSEKKSNSQGSHYCQQVKRCYHMNAGFNRMPYYQATNYTNDVEQTLHQIQHQFQQIEKDLSFQLDETFGDYSIVIADRKTGKIIIQVPAHEVTHFQNRLDDVSQDIESNTISSVFLDRRV